MANPNRTEGVSLAKGPVLVVGLALVIFGVLALIFGGHHFNQHAISGTQNGQTFLGVEGNGWTNLLFVGAGALLIFGSPLHWGAKSLSLIVGLVLGAASVIAIVDKNDVFGIFAANGLTKLVWGVAAVVLLILALLPRVGGKKETDDRDDVGSTRARPARRVQREPRTRPREEPVDVGSPHGLGDGRVVAPASGTTPESRETTRRQRDRQREPGAR